MLHGGINWAKLVSEGRAKSIGVSFSDKDWNLIRSGKKTAKEIREDYETSIIVEKSKSIKIPKEAEEGKKGEEGKNGKDTKTSK